MNFNTINKRVGILNRNGKIVYYVFDKAGNYKEFDSEIDASNHANILDAFNR